jgi:hypothetical protein
VTFANEQTRKDFHLLPADRQSALGALDLELMRSGHSLAILYVDCLLLEVTIRFDSSVNQSVGNSDPSSAD